MYILLRTPTYREFRNGDIMTIGSICLTLIVTQQKIIVLHNMEVGKSSQLQ